MENRAIQIHASAVDRITLENGVAVLHFPKAYIGSPESVRQLAYRHSWASCGVWSV